MIPVLLCFYAGMRLSPATLSAIFLHQYHEAEHLRVRPTLPHVRLLHPWPYMVPSRVWLTSLHAWWKCNGRQRSGSLHSAGSVNDKGYRNSRHTTRAYNLRLADGGYPADSWLPQSHLQNACMTLYLPVSWYRGH